MKFDFGTVIVIVVVLLFYLRLMLLQWGKSRRLRDLQTILPKSKKGQPAPQVRNTSADIMRFRFKNIYLTILGIVIMIAGAVMVAMPGLDMQIRQWWWIAVSLGVILFGFMIR